MDFFAHEKAIVESTGVGKGTRVWAFAHILPGAVIGDDCNICDGVFIGPNATFTNDMFPRSKQPQKTRPETLIKKGASIGANATILPGIVVGRESMVGAGAVVTQNVPSYAIVVGNPARVIGYVDTTNTKVIDPCHISATPRGSSVGVGGVTLYQLPEYSDIRGVISVIEYSDILLFEPKRCFFVYGVPSKYVRGEHAHRRLHEFLVCVSGSCAVIVDDGRERKEVILDTPWKGLYVPPIVWTIQYKFSENAVLAVLASDRYEAEDYIRDYEEFLKSIE